MHIISRSFTMLQARAGKAWQHVLSTPIAMNTSWRCITKCLLQACAGQHGPDTPVAMKAAGCCCMLLMRSSRKVSYNSTSSSTHSTQ